MTQSITKQNRNQANALYYNGQCSKDHDEHIDKRLLEPISILEYHGLSARIINILEERKYFLINDLRKIMPDTKIHQLSNKGIKELKNALQAYLTGQPKKTLTFNNAQD